jgi:hypothetical protein
MKKICLILVYVCFTIFNIQAQTSNAKMQSVFIYNFTKLVNWPGSYQSGNFIIGVLGNSPIIAELENMASTKKAGSQTIVIEKYASVDAIKKCHILVIPDTQSGKIAAALGKTSGNNTLIVTDVEGGTKKGASINFVVIDSKQKFELSETNASSKGLKIGAELIKLAIVK